MEITITINETLLTDETITNIGAAVLGSLKDAGHMFHVDGQAMHVVGPPAFDIGYERQGIR